ncbi:MAG: NlpC/P60 family protein [Chitinophagaceae bacterium]
MFTYTIVGLWVIITASSCRSLKSSSSSRIFPAKEAQPRPAIKDSDNSKRVYKGGGIQQNRQPGSQEIRIANPYLGVNSDIEKTRELQFKYCVYIDVPVELLTDSLLLSFMDEWYGVRYRYGGSTKNGIDCSAFSSEMLNSVFGYQVPRTVREQYQACTLLTKEELREGDLVFFNTTGGISHVGVFLMNNKFVHASSSSGVMISDLNEAYFAKRFLGGGRVILTTSMLLPFWKHQTLKS